MVRALGAGLHQAQLHLGVAGGALEHLPEQGVRHKVRAGTGGQVPAPGQGLHGPVVDFLVAPLRVFHRLAGLGKGRRVQDDVVVRPRGQVGQQIKDVGHLVLHGEAVAGGVLFGAGDGRLADIHRVHPLGPGLGAVEPKGAGVGEAVQHGLPRGDAGGRGPVVLLVQEKAGLLAVLKVHQVADAVFHNLRLGGFREGLARQGVPALVLLQAFQLPYLHVVALVNPPDGLAAGLHGLHQGGEDPVLAQLGAQAQRLGDQNVPELVHGQPGEAVGLPKDDAAAVHVRAHDGFAVVPGILGPPGEKGLVELIVGVLGEQPHPDFRVGVVIPRAQVPALGAAHVAEGAVLRGALLGGNLVVEHPGVALLGALGPPGVDGDKGVRPFCLHGFAPFWGCWGRSRRSLFLL